MADRVIEISAAYGEEKWDKRHLEAEIHKLIEEHTGAAEAMRKGKAHPHVPGMHEQVVRALDRVLAPRAQR